MNDYVAFRNRLRLAGLILFAAFLLWLATEAMSCHVAGGWRW